jgi:hypothetical protein
MPRIALGNRINSNYFRLVAVFLTVLVYAVVSVIVLRPAPTQAQSQPTFSCNNNLYLAQNSSNTQLNTLDINITPATLTSIGSSYSAGYNAMGYRFSNGYIYGYDTANDQYVRIGSSGTAQGIGNDTDIPDVTYAAGDFDASGNHNMLQYTNDMGSGNTNQWVVTDVSSGTPTMLDEFNLTNDTGGGLAVGDVAFNPKDGKFYGVDMVNRRAVMISIGSGSGTVTHFGPVQTQFATEGAHGAAYINSRGQLISVQNNPGRIFKIDIGVNGNGTAAATLLSSSPTVNQYDGASCPYVPHLEKLAIPESVLAGGAVKYEYTIYNPIPGQSLLMTFTDTMDDGRTYVADTLSNTHGGTANDYAETDELTITGLTVPAGSSVSFTVDVLIPETTPSGTLLNQACINTFSEAGLMDEVCSDYPVSPIFGDPTPVEVTGVAAPDTGMARIKNNPFAVLLFTSSAAGGIALIARRIHART